MFKDIELSKDIMAAFNESQKAQIQLPKFDFNVFVLTSGYWPTYPLSKMLLPHDLLECQRVFSDFYLSKHSGRRLTWQNSLGHCIINAQFPKVKFNVSLISGRA